jgi:hypothetical protein
MQQHGANSPNANNSSIGHLCKCTSVQHLHLNEIPPARAKSLKGRELSEKRIRKPKSQLLSTPKKMN